MVETVFDSMAQALAKGGRAEVRGLCSFFVKEYKGYTGRNPKTGELVTVKEKRLPFFKPGLGLKKKGGPVKQKSDTMIFQPLDFEKLVGAIHRVHAELAAQAKRAVNASLTLRNWMIGGHITEYEQNGADRAKYGDRLLGRLSASLSSKGVSRVEERELRRYRQFYQTCPQIRETVSPESR